MAFQVFAKIHTPVGAFTGYASDDLPTSAEAEAQRDAIQEMLRSCDSFTIFSDTNPGAQLTVAQSTIKNSVFEFVITNN